MTDLPRHADLHEGGPRSGFQIENRADQHQRRDPVDRGTPETGLHHTQAAIRGVMRVRHQHL
jgi:hypothetical protein